MDRRYDQPVRDRALNPTVAFLSTVETPRPGVVVLCEGFPDALTVAHTGLAAVAVLGTAHAGPDGVGALTGRITARFPDMTTFLVCFDDDTASRPGKLPAGQNAAASLADRLAHRGHLVVTVMPPVGVKDLNDWWQQNPDDLHRTLTATADHFTGFLPHTALPSSTWKNHPWGMQDAACSP
ncbi:MULTISPECIES: toprim domain-containing protein [unclassified Frankia]|uniref:toprim domain-containing protein n=1 Tax=unclassified Frankia TaxID=2632575 RepID=UPI002AD3A496|nr:MULTISPECIES: toprim domain-containing protein [unclassified Frankia]